MVWENGSPGPHRVLPDGCLDLVWAGGEVVVAGPDTGFRVVSGGGGVVLGLRFTHGMGPVVLGVPAVELVDRLVPLADLWGGAEAERLAERLAEASAPGAVLASLAARRMGEAGPDPLAAELFAGPVGSVAGLAGRVGLSERQLHRRALASFGYGVKTLMRVRRLSGALDLLREGVAPAEAAVRGGYADQAHLGREVKAMTGLPPSAYRPAR
ncbi:helix-turn-helix transcriptional regulator [Actinocorallia herbida]|uniref:helix-turn-helix transcriptional regulator n=1 Tax=Actinocorallia herbida TaxID=58109 RepID=UPI00319E93DC